MPPTQPKYLWSTPAEARHSVRLIADEEGLTWAQKQLLCQIINCESGFNIHAINKNMAKDGITVLSTDRGICQWNDYWHWTRTGEISPDEALHLPAKAVRLMCKYVKQGLMNQWVCFSKGLYEHYKP